ncbi:MAG: hypothetical protein WCJ61_05430, partial [Paludibacter sp.]
MRTKILFLLFIVFTFKSLMAADVVLNNFESGSAAVTTLYGSSSSKVANPLSSGNTTANCLKVGRTSTNWWEAVSFPISFTVPANTTKYVHILVDYTLAPGLSISPNGSGQIDQSNGYGNFGKWRDIIFAIPGGTGGLTETSL